MKNYGENLRKMQLFTKFFDFLRGGIIRLYTHPRAKIIYNHNARIRKQIMQLVRIWYAVRWTLEQHEHGLAWST